VVVIFREHITAFRETAQALRGRSAFPVLLLPLDPEEPLQGLRRDVEVAEPEVVVALGPLAARVAARGLEQSPLVFAYGSGPPETTARQGGWLRHDPRPAAVLRWLVQIRPKLSSVGMVLPDKRDRRIRRLQHVARQQGIRLRLAYVGAAGDALTALVSLLSQRPQAVWLGFDVRPWTPARLRAALALQVLTGVPVVGITPAHVKRGLAMAVDASPETVAATLDAFIRARIRGWLAARARSGSARRRRGRDRLHRRWRGGNGRRRGAGGDAARASLKAGRLVSRRVPARRVTLNPRSLRALGLSPDKALAAGAKGVLR
jgi:hypothetical protein